MPVCVFCSRPVPALYIEYGDKNIALTKCSDCGKFADPYVEFKFVVLILDLLLQKASVYRHLLFNRYDAYELQKQILKLVTFVWCIDVYSKYSSWQFLIQDGKMAFWNYTLFQKIYSLNAMNFVIIHNIYLFFMVLLEYCVLVGSIWLIYHISHIAIKSLHKDCSGFHNVFNGLFLASLGKLMIIIMVIWSYHEPIYVWLINIFVWTSQITAIYVCLDVAIRQYNVGKVTVVNERKSSRFRIAYACITVFLGIAAKTLFQYLICIFLDTSYPITIS